MKRWAKLAILYGGWPRGKKGRRLKIIKIRNAIGEIITDMT